MSTPALFPDLPDVTRARARRRKIVMFPIFCLFCGECEEQRYMCSECRKLSCHEIIWKKFAGAQPERQVEQGANTLSDERGPAAHSVEGAKKTSEATECPA